jgi:hypothetical protein
MASRNNTRTSAHSNRSTAARSSHEAQTAASQEAVTQVSRHSLSLLAQSAAAAFRGAEVWQEAQLAMLGRSRNLMQEFAESMQQARDPAQLLYIQAHLLASSWQQLQQFAADLMRGGVAAQSEAGMPMAQAQNATAAQAQNAAATGLDMITPAVQAWQSMVGGTMPGMNTSASRPH